MEKDLKRYDGENTYVSSNVKKEINSKSKWLIAIPLVLLVIMLLLLFYN